MTYIIKRLLLVIPTVWLVTVVVFLTVRLIPGDIIDAMIADLEERSLGGELTSTAEGYFADFEPGIT